MRKFLTAFAVLVSVLILGSCKNAQDVAYFQNIDEVDLSASKGLYTARIMPKDELTITVNSSDPAAASVFNLTVSKTTGNNTDGMSSQQRLITYVVDNEGYINFPQLGKIHVLGMSREELQDYICKRISPFFAATDTPIVTVTMSNYRVTVMGEVTSPKVVSVDSERMSVLEAIASAGDLGIYGKRYNILIIREDVNGEKSAHKLDLRDANVINDPYYYVQQNDVIYVTPNKTKAKNSDIGQSTTLTTSIVSILISIASLMYNILN